MHCKAQFQQINQYGRQTGVNVWVIPQYIVFYMPMYKFVHCLR